MGYAHENLTIPSSLPQSSVVNTRNFIRRNNINHCRHPEFRQLYRLPQNHQQIYTNQQRDQYNKRNIQSVNHQHKQQQRGYFATDDDDDLSYDCKKFEQFSRLSSHRNNSGPLSGLNIIVKRFLSFVACPALTSSMRYGQEC